STIGAGRLSANRLVLYLDAGRRDPLGLGSTLTPFAHDALEVALAVRLKKLAATSLEMLHIEQARIDARHEPKSHLSNAERSRSADVCFVIPHGNVGSGSRSKYK